MLKKTLIAIIALFSVSLLSRDELLAQSPSAQLATISSDPSLAADDLNLKLFRKDLRSLKKQLIAANLDLTEAEALQFWPIYDAYATELTSIIDRKYALLTDYAQNYATMTGDQAEAYIRGRAAVDEAVMQLRLKYVPKFRKSLSGRLTALFFQLEWRLGMMIDLQLASQTPLIEP